ncbi:hypothetical protein M0R88_09395 [Halorussus gelatinilyticus]|uniref:Uncharacterized protein n=1 Tax=Halorussus gelatinilyticus TaxID=2937524 RepID=A0A8U0IMC7_9EURY|nr:hypothetical protein [Halorussus gelatinilyticus]UPW02287.1 hypothetical protein M0R88_09395 [Halorussus gelatinilyticus]
MQTVVPLGGLAAAGLVCSLAAVGVAGFFGRGSDDEDDLAEVARRLDAREDPDAIARRLDDLEDAIDDLAGDADLDRHLRDAPAADATGVEKAEALSRAVEGDRLSIRPPRTGDADAGADGAVADAAARLRRDRTPSSPAARKLLDAAAAPDRADPDELDAALERAVTALDRQRALERAVGELPDDGPVAPGDARRAGNHLDRTDGELTAGVQRLVETVAESEERGESADAGSDAGDADDGVQSVAADVRREQRPESAVAKRLLDRLASPGIGDLRASLDTAVEQLDAASTTQSIVAELDRESVAELADSVADRLDGRSGPVADALGERVGELRGMVDRADDSNAVIPYAVRNELRFYDRTLLARLDEGSDAGASEMFGDEAFGDASGGASAGESGTSPDDRIAAVADRREEFEDRYVDGRRDHNHSIPLHFLSLVDALREDAEEATAVGDDARATGLAAAADETLDYVEKLYERNEYSVMLRRLRG